MRFREAESEKSRFSLGVGRILRHAELQKKDKINKSHQPEPKGGYSGEGQTKRRKRSLTLSASCKTSRALNRRTSKPFDSTNLLRTLSS